MEIKRQYRPEIEGLRAIAALLVAVYHIWMMRVSGGVDVFFVVSGFLITTSLLSRYARDGYIKFWSFILGLLRRLLPSALTVMTFVAVASFFILPDARFLSIIKEITASLLYFENWQLAITGTDYLDQNNPQSPVQHFWAMSIQGQFYVIWFVIVTIAIFISKKMHTSFRKVFTAVLLTLFTVSLFYSIYMTSANQPWAYFDTGARVFEFAAGGLVMIYIFNLNINKYLSFVFGWTGLAILLFTGLILDVQATFPGYIALLPVSAAILILLAGQNPTRFGVEKLLSTSPLKFLGSLSYGIYLWHWPLLIFYYELFDVEKATLSHGILIILLSLALSYITTTLVEKPIIKVINKHNFSLKSFSPIIALALILVIGLSSWYFSINSQSSQTVSGNADYPGAMVNSPEYDESSFEEKEPFPALANAKEDKAVAYSDGCQVSPGDADVKVCEYGNTDTYNHTIALVGGSKSTHWLPSLQELGEDYRILNVTKSGCRFSLENSDSTPSDCYEWNTKVVDKLVEYEPDLVVTLADIARSQYKEVPEGFIEQFEKLNSHDIPVLAIRDTPYFSEDVVECLSQDENSDGCGIEKNKTIADNPAWEKLSEPPENVVYTDYTNYICHETYCPAVVGNIVAYFDKSHMTASFNKTFTPIIREDIEKILLE